MEFYTQDTITEIDIQYPDIYFTPEYGKACTHNDGGIWELVRFKDVIFVYIKDTNKRTINTPYGYSGIYYENISSINEFLPLIKKHLKSFSYKELIIRQNPYITRYNLPIHPLKQKLIYSVELHKYNSITDYLSNTDKNNRQKINKSIKNNCIFDIKPFHDIHSFHSAYIEGMKILNAKDNYLYDTSYFKLLQTLNCLHATVSIDNKIVAQAIILKYKDFLHYHLGISSIEYRKYGINNFLHYNVIEFGISNNLKLYVLGGGLENNDNLAKFKNKISNKQFEYNIYKIICE